MSLPRFLDESLDDILAEWQREHGIAPPAQAARRHHFGKVLRAVAEDMGRAGAVAPAPGTQAAAAAPSPAGRLVGDYASLRASVVRQWQRKHPSPSRGDIEDLVRFHEAMDRSLAELAATFSQDTPEQPRALLLGVLNHELRTSVASIGMSAQVLTHRAVAGSAEAKAAQRIARSCEQLRQTLDALSEITDVPLGAHLDIDRVPDDVGVLCRRALDAYARVDPERRVRLTSDGDLAGNWDEVRLASAIRSLIANAARFASRGSVVTVAAHGDAPGEVRVTVHGDGTPIDLDTLRTIFDPVARVESENATYAGLGLGLFLVRKVVDAHGGRVDVESADGGTTFTVVLPRDA